MPLIRTQDGSDSILSEKFGVSYHSRFGAVMESAHVFIDTGLRHKSALRQINVLEAGFGSGLNAMMTWLEADRQGIFIQYLGLEAFPLAIEQAAQLNYPVQLHAADRSADFLELHSLPWNTPVRLSPHFMFEKQQCYIEDFNKADDFDVIYFDAFAPQIQPELWTLEVMSRMFNALHPEGILVTYCVQGAFRRDLVKAGFHVEKLPGPQGKWEITRATKPADASRA